jgi:Icc-related predicted phosphoesterase
MRLRIRKLKGRIQTLGGVDIVVTHAPPLGLGDADDPAHWGFEALRGLLDEYHPRYLVHGHVHLNYGYNIPREITYHDTTIINATERYVLNVPDVSFPEKDRGQVIRKKIPWLANLFYSI